MDQLQSTMNKKVKSLENQLEDALEEKHSAVKVCRILYRVLFIVVLSAHILIQVSCTVLRL